MGGLSLVNPSIIFPLMCNAILLCFPHSGLSQSETGSRKENPPSQRRSSCQLPSQFTCKDSGYEPTTSTSAATAANSRPADDHHQSIDRDLDTDISLASQREEGEGWDREQAKRLEERNKWFEKGIPFSEMGSRWDSMELKRGSVPVPVIETMDSEVNRKWAEFETLLSGDMSAQSLIGAQADQSSTLEALESPDSSQICHLGPEEVKQSVRGSQPINGVQTNQSYTAEALKREVRNTLHSVHQIITNVMDRN